MSAEQNDLARLLFQQAATDRCATTVPEIDRLCQEAASAVLAAGWTRPRTITTDTELRDLEVESIIRDVDGLPKEKQTDTDGYTFWASPGHKKKFSTTDICLPATVLYEPTPEAAQ